MKCISACKCERLCGCGFVSRRPGSGLQCVELHGRVSGEGLGLHTVKIRRSMTRKLICGVEGGELANLTPDSLLSSILSLILGRTCPIDKHEQMALLNMKEKVRGGTESIFPLYFLSEVCKHVCICPEERGSNEVTPVALTRVLIQR